MTKRNGDLPEMKFKKLKTDRDFDDLWGDDSSIEDCLIQATQVCEQVRENRINGVADGNISIFPNYSFFEHGNKEIFTSTQNVCNGTMIRSTNHNNNKSGNKSNVRNGSVLLQNNELITEVKTLKEKYECKEGEVSILRTQLKDTKTNMELEHQKREKEWAEKLNSFNKEINSVKSELEFKNLEVVNLKNKILEISKAYTMDNLYNNSQNITSHKKGDGNVYTFYTKEYKLEPILDAKYPLMNTIPLIMFNSKQSENFVINLRTTQASNYLNENGNDEVLAKYKNIIEAKHYKLDSILQDVSALVKFNCFDLDTRLSYRYVDQILSVSKYVLQSLHDYLNISDDQVQKDDESSFKQTDERDNQKFSVFDSCEWCDREIGIRARQTVGIVAEILPYSTYMQKTLLSDVTNRQDIRNDNNYLSLISVIINLIHKTKRTELCNGFLCAVAILLYKISQTSEFPKSSFFVLNISEKIISARPSDIVLRNLILFFKQASKNGDFSKELCKMSKSDDAGRTSNSCQLPAFIVSYKQAFIEKENLDVVLGLNTLQFIKNLLNCNCAWLHYIENNTCDCLCKVVTLGIDVIYELVKNYKTKKRKLVDKEQYSQQNNEIVKYCLEILHIISSKYFDVIGKYSVDSQYKFVVNYLNNLEDELSMADFESEALRELNIHDEVVAIESTSFDKIPIWK